MQESNELFRVIQWTDQGSMEQTERKQDLGWISVKSNRLWNSLPKEATEAPLLESFNAGLDKVLKNSLYWTSQHCQRRQKKDDLISFSISNSCNSGDSIMTVAVYLKLKENAEESILRVRAGS